MKFLGVLWGLRLRRTERELALSLPFMLPSAHYKDVGVRIASFRSSKRAFALVTPTGRSGPPYSFVLNVKRLLLINRRYTRKEAVPYYRRLIATLAIGDSDTSHQSCATSYKAPIRLSVRLAQCGPEERQLARRSEA
jgi:hypothetical protein